jgi:hypothetical protein
MKPTAICLFAALCLILLAGWTTDQTDDLTKSSWLLGTWANKSPRGIIYESWSSLNENEFAGKSYAVKQQDTMIFETIQLVSTEEGLDYIPTVNGQNGGLPVRFSSTTITDTQLKFENPKHDFPQIITYTLINPDSLVAEISGIANGQTQKQSFRMKRVN